MIVNAYVVIDPKGDRPYVTTEPPSKDLDLKGGTIKIYHYMLHVPDAQPSTPMPGILNPEHK